MELNSRSREWHPSVVESRQEVVERAEAYLRMHMDGSVPVSTLSRVVGLSERGLRNAFYGVRGMSPKRYMLAERLQGARRALSRGGAGAATVTGVATEYGFYELGRFAASYKAAFGETPSATLRSAASRQLLADHTVQHEGGR